MRQSDRQAYRQTEKQPERQTGRETQERADEWTSRQTDGQKNRRMEGQTVLTDSLYRQSLQTVFTDRQRHNVLYDMFYGRFSRTKCLSDNCNVSMRKSCGASEG
jgi:hypothetical protein